MSSYYFWVFVRFLQRDFLAMRTQFKDLFVNYIFILPLLTTFDMGYILPSIFFGGTPEKTTILFIGSITLPAIVLTFKLAMWILFDLDKERFIVYQMSLLPPQLALLERIVFATIMSFLMMIPFYPVAKLLLGASFVTTNTSWAALFVMLFLSCMMSSAYNVLAMVVMTHPSQMSQLWMRFNIPLFLFGGFAVPWAGIYQFSPWFAYANLLNPLIYVTEGLRQAVFTTPAFFSLTTCTVALTSFTVIFYLVGLRFLKLRTDHI